MRDAYSEALIRLGDRYPNVVVLDADLEAATRTARFGQRFPDRYIQVGIAEQNMAGVAAGLATTGLIPVINSFAVFATCRALDQIRTSVAQPGLPVKIIGSYSGLLVSKSGCTHTSVEDLALMRALPGLTVIAPGDDREAAEVTELLPEIPGPVYVRLSRNPISPIIGRPFKVGRAVTLREGRDVAIISTGTMTSRVLEAAHRLHQKGVEAEVLHVPTIKPFDVDALVTAAARCRLVVTAEEHSRIGGLGSAVAECLSERLPTPVFRIGINDEYGESGSDTDLLRKFGLDAEGVERAVVQALRVRRESQGG